MSEKLKKLTGKNPRDFEPVAYSLINEPDEELFKELVSRDDFLFDFVKQNVVLRMAKVCNKTNYLNLFKFLKYYSPSYEEFIVSTLAKFANEDLTDRMLALFEDGNEDEKTYCATFFSYVKDPLAIEFLKENSYSENHSLSANCASTLAVFEERSSYNDAIQKLESDDDFEVLEGVKFLVSYGDRKALENIICAMKKSPLAENIATELPYLKPLSEILKDDFESGLYILNLIIGGLGEVSSLSQVFDFQLYENFESILNNEKASTVLLHACDKFETLTENDEYLYDEQKDVKQEVFDIKNLLLNNLNIENLKTMSDKELTQDSPFVFTALEYTSNSEKVRQLLNSNNQTLILKALEVLKKLENLTQTDKETALKNTTNNDIKKIIEAI